MTPEEFIEKLCGLYVETEPMTKHVIAETARYMGDLTNRATYGGINSIEDLLIKACEVEHEW